MKKLYIGLLLSVMTLTLAACANTVETTSESECTCKNCKCCKCDEEQSGIKVENAEDIFAQEKEAEETSEPVEIPQTEVSTIPETESEAVTEEETIKEAESEVQPPSVEKKVSELTDGERAARKQQQINFASTREQFYALPNSLSKTQKINEMDKQILANNSFDFSTKTIQFLGDSITEAICGNVNEEGGFISYVDYANDYLEFNMCMNNGKAGRMFSDYGGSELSFSLDMGSMYNNSADISVIFLGVNDYLTGKENKRYGDMNATESTAGYIGSVRHVLKQLKANYPNQDIFFVTMYDIAKTSNSTYSDIIGSPKLEDYMEVLRTLVKESGYHLIELYDIGFMDCNDTTTSDIYTADGLHPNDNGNRILGEHIAAELSIYYSQRQ